MIAIVNSGGANLASVLFAFERMGKPYVFTSDPDVIRRATHVLLPGVGTARHAMETLEATDGLIDCLRALTQPVMGICLGMQLLFDRSEEGDVPMLGVIPGNITLFENQGLPVPHTGWNTIEPQARTPLLAGINSGSYFYFVHSYHAACGPNALATTTYGRTFASMVARDNYFGCQFHPERSGATGAILLENFTRL